MNQLGIHDIYSLQKEIKKNGKKYYTNYYTIDSADDFQIVKGKESVVFFAKEECFQRAYYFTSDLDELTSLFMRMKEMLVMDIICQGDMKEEEKRAFEQAGFAKYAVYCKRQYPLEKGGRTEKDTGIFDEFYNPDFFQFAKDSDVPEIEALLYSVFDTVVSHLPTKERLAEMVQNRNVVCYRANGQIVALYIFLVQGRKLYSNISYNIASADVLYSMERRARELAYEEYGVKWVYAWYDIENKKALRRSVYIDTGLRDYIYVKKDEQ